MTLIKKTTASVALVALTSGLFVNGVSANSNSEVEAANKLAAAGIINSKTNAAEYELGRQVLRQEIAAVARGLAGVDKTSTCTNMFKDVSAKKPNDWACYTVEALANANLIAKNAKFRPESNITKAEAVGMIVKAAYGDEYSPEAGKGDWQKQVVDFAVSKGIASQFSNYTTPATRGFVFEVAAKTLKTDVTSANTNDDFAKILESLTGGTTTDNNVTSPKAEVRNDSNLAVSLSAQSPSNGVIMAESDRAAVLAFDVTAGKEDVTLKKASFKFTGSGDVNLLRKLAIYADDVKVTRGDDVTFNSRLEANLSFDRNIVIKAGETKTLFVTSYIDPTKSANVYNQLVRVALTNLEASSTVTGAELTGATLTPYKVANKAEIRVTTSAVNGNMYLGQENSLYNFSVAELRRREDLVVKSVSFKAEGEAKIENISNLSLMNGSNKVDAKFTYSKGKVVATLNETIKAGEKVNFTLKGEAVDDLDKTLKLSLNDIYIVGKTSDVALTDKDTTIATSDKKIVGTKVNFTFKRENGIEVSPETRDVKIGDLVFNTTSNYTADLEVTVRNLEKITDKNRENGYRDLSIEGLNGNEVTGKDNTYKFEGVTLNKGTTTLPLTVDFEKVSPDGKSVTFEVRVTKLTEETLGEDLKTTTGVLNNGSLAKTVVVRQNSFTLTPVRVQDTAVLPRNNPEVVLFKGRIDLNGGENITLENLTFDATASTGNVTEYISGATLSIGGVKFTGEVSNGKIDFNSIYAEIEKSSKNVQVLLTATLSDVKLDNGVQLKATLPTMSTGNRVELKGASVSAKNATGIKAYTNTNITSTVVNLKTTEGIVITPVSTSTKDRTVLAGSTKQKIGSFKLSETSSEIYVSKLELDKDSTSISLNGLSNITLMDGSNPIATGGYVEGDKIVFSGFTLKSSPKTRDITVEADLATYQSSGGQEEVNLGKLLLSNVRLSSPDLSTTGTETTVSGNVANTEFVYIVPVKYTFDRTTALAKDVNAAVVKVKVDKGNNDVSDVKLKALTFNNPALLSSLDINGNNVFNTAQTKASKVELAQTLSNLDLPSNDFEMVITFDANTDTNKALFYLNEVEFTYGNNVNNVFTSEPKLNLGSYTK